MGIARKLASAIIREPSRHLEMLSWNARFNKWLAANKGVPTTPSRLLAHAQVNQWLDGPITYLEFGVFQGESIKYWLSINQHPDSRFFGFDTFTGLPEDFGPGHPVGVFDVGGRFPQTDDPRVKFIAGLFQDTLPGFEIPDGQLVIHIDCDIFSGAMFVLATLNQHIRPGTIIIFDEFCVLLEEFKAWTEYLAIYYRSAETLVMTPQASQVAFRVTK